MAGKNQKKHISWREHCMEFKYQCINNASLEDSHDYSLTYYYLGCFGAMEAELSSCDRDLYGSQHLKSLQLFMEGVCWEPWLRAKLTSFYLCISLKPLMSDGAV